MRPVAEQPAQGWSCEGATSAPVAATHSACGRRLQARQWQARGRDQRPRGVIYEHRGLTCMPFSCVPKCPFLCLGHSEGSRPRFAGSRRGVRSRGLRRQWPRRAPFPPRWRLPSSPLLRFPAPRQAPAQPVLPHRAAGAPCPPRVLQRRRPQSQEGRQEAAS